MDILLVAFLLFRLLKLIRGTRAWRILGGVVGFVVVWAGAEYLKLSTLAWLMKQAVPLAPFAIALLLLPELRAMIEGFGNIGLIPSRLVRSDHAISDRTIDDIVAVSFDLATKRVGALIIIERGPHLADVVASGTPLDAKVSRELLGSIFYGANPLHDGAVVVRGNALVAAACRLPLSENPRIDVRMHLRHRAGIGVTEVMDCLAVIVSEERGQVTVAQNGDYRKVITSGELRKAIVESLRGPVRENEENNLRRMRRRERDKQAKKEEEVAAR